MYAHIFKSRLKTLLLSQYCLYTVARLLVPPAPLKLWHYGRSMPLQMFDYYYYYYYYDY